ncbi:sensor histidine kinase [Pseudotenacibaculum sp. MALMAid0570]|uniref:sensor histidine kinase n=1 Tax=Pseudotenacibaculum sp. MALMAid0570 TaxID=3143938 RepID=UPI0032DF573A
MKKKLNIRALIVLIALMFFSNYSAYSLDTKTSLLIFQQKQDSTLYKMYERADSLYKAKLYVESLREAHSALDKAIDVNDKEHLYKINLLIGKLWYDSYSYQKSVSYFKQSLYELIGILREKNSIKSKVDKRLLLNNYKYLSLNFEIGKAYQKSFESLNSKDENESRILNVNDSTMKVKFRDSLLYYYNEILKSNLLSNNSLTLKSLVYNNIAGQYIRDSLYDQAKDYALKSLKIKKTLGDNYSIVVGYITVSNIYYVKKQYKKSKETLFKSLESLNGMKGEKFDKLRAAIYLNIAYCMNRLKDYNAYSYQKKSWELYDKFNKDKHEKELMKINADRNYEKGKQEGIFQEEIKRQKVERNNWIIGLSSITVIIFLGFLLNQNKLRQKNLSLELSKKETESEMQVLNANLKGQEAERKRISQELHDGVLSKLFGSRMGLGYLELDSNAETQSQYQKYLADLHNIEKEIREVSHQLSSDISLSETSFLNAINQLLKEKSTLGKFNFQLKMDDGFSWKELDGVIEMNVFRILQESLQNILKHAKAKNVTVGFKAKNDFLIVTIEDDGVGFDISKKSKGIGLKNMKSRIKTLKATLNVASEIDKGTTIELKVPVV